MAKTQRLDKILSNMGYGTRKEIKIFIKKNNVKVNGVGVKDGSFHVSPHEDMIEINGERLDYRDTVYLMMNKPQGVISASFDPKVETVVDLLDEGYRIFELFPVGRLDKDTEGLLILTNDGKLAHELLAPKKHVPKTYFAVVDGKVTNQDQESFQKGVTLDDGYVTQPAELILLKSDDISEIELTIYEGKFHQVKRMFEAVGKKVTYLKRIAMGSLKLDSNLDLGEYRELTEEEMQILMNR
ncbi:16S rRNA pseudouridine516 synthase [Anaerosolibacter carboniphilus]|uniref:Pseudouridine synthase n=1 Tax=Anaerosolibacter carboniphilus TaxID=1417629 RepID=A0A841KRF0_9FIRM|nr:pseudouridine synthase [Anaerosolibacter carboniphilus]MBB6214650.1 16S rRNA pseudouridine516 synthase [Anaerosolibacter carboniphilus]